MGSTCRMANPNPGHGIDFCSFDFSHCGPHEWGEAIQVKFDTGAVRSSVTAGGIKPADYSQHTAAGMRRLAEAQAEGNTKYGYGNWQKGIPVSNLLSHALAHIFALQCGDISEDHLGHALWNLDKAAHFIETRPDLIDVVPLRDAMMKGNTTTNG